MSENKKKETKVEEKAFKEVEKTEANVKEPITPSLSDLTKKEEALKEELTKVKASKYEMTQEVPAAQKSITELIMEQRKMRKVSDNEYLLKKAVIAQARKMSNANAIGASPMNPIIINKGK